MTNSLPQDIKTLLNWSWSEIEPHYNDLAARTLSAQNVTGWLADWTAIDDRVSEMYARLHVATTVNTADKDADARYKSFLDTIYLGVEAAEQKLREKLLKSGLEPMGLAVPLKKMRAEADLYREANLPLLTEERKLAIEYDKIVGAQTVQWDGKEVTISQLRPVYLSADREKRERAWRAAIQRQLTDRMAINVLWQKFLPLRQELAANAGRSDYRTYRWQQMLRFDYTPADCVTFQNAIEQAVVPAAKRIYEKRRKRLGVQILRPWDLEVDTLARAPLKPFSHVDELKKIASSIFRRVDPRFGDYYDTMARESLLDLANRKNKAPGAYCTSFPMSRRPFVFANAVGLHDDLQTMLHESGHAFHNFEKNPLPYSQQRQVGLEFAEVASMGMELLAAPYLAAEKGGVYSDADAARARIEHLEKVILFWPYMAVVDAFQHWVYEHPADSVDPSKCDAQWMVQWMRFMGGVDWSGLEHEMMTGWHRKLHIHQVPFYYVEYGLAQVGAVQIWGNALNDQAGAVAGYRRALALGGTVSLPELYATAGAKFAFDAGTLRTYVDLMERTIEKLEGNA
ncbi:MAG: M3 family oligoendopeptidase [Chloroflexota bacterium]|nr:M3 family oligoendopeptidase [Chloroflexota bacterium]